MHRGISSVVPKGQSVGEMHTRLKEPECRGNVGRRHRDYRIRSASAQYHVGALSGGLQQYEQAVATYSRQVTDLRKRVAEYEKRSDSELRWPVRLQQQDNTEQDNRARLAGWARWRRVRGPKLGVFETSNPELRTSDRAFLAHLAHVSWTLADFFQHPVR